MRAIYSTLKISHQFRKAMVNGAATELKYSSMDARVVKKILEHMRGSDVGGQLMKRLTSIYVSNVCNGSCTTSLSMEIQA